jgi:APA family basic amino acid/polyamine antiporter
MPALPLALLGFIAAAGYVVFGSVRSNPGNALRGTLLLLAGIVVFVGMRRRRWAWRAGSGAVS